MKLYNIYYVCKMAMQDLKEVEIIDVSTRRDDFKETAIAKFPNYKRALDTLSQLEFIKDSVKDAANSIALIEYGRRGAIIYSNKEKIVSSLHVIKSKVQTIIDLYESMKEVQYQQGIDIYIPPCKYLKDYRAILKEIDFIISQCPYLRCDNEEFQYNGTDVGSDWITLGVAITGVVTTTSYILNNFAELTKKVQEIRVRFQMIDQNEELIKTMKIRNELLKEMQEVYAKEKEDTFNKAVAELKENLGDLNDGEEEGKVLKSLEKYNALLDSGVRFYSSIESPREIKELLPSSDDPKALSDTIIKYLEDKDKNSTEN